jgi:hypothetical protein
MRGNHRIFDFLLSCPEIDVNFVSPAKGCTLLSEAVFFGASIFVSKLFQSGLLDLESEINQKAAFDAFSNGNLHLTTVIVDGFDAEHFYFDCCTWALQGNRPLLHEAVATGKSKFVAFFASYEEASYVVGDQNVVALAFKVADLEIIEILLQASASKFRDAFSALDFSHLLGCSVTLHNPELIRDVIACFKKHSFAYAISQEALEQAAFQAARLNCPEFVDLFIEMGVSHNARDDSSYSLLETAALYNFIEVADLLIRKYRVNVNNCISSSGRTALHVAAMHDSVGVADLLLAAGARHTESFIYQVGEHESMFHSCTPLDLAEQSGSHQVACLLCAKAREGWAMQTSEIFNSGL